MLEAKNITINYGPRQAVVDVSLRLNPGEVLAIIGPNGAGKSSLLRTLNGALKPTRGEVLLDDQPIQSYARRAIARRIAVVAQEADLRFPVTVLEFVLGGRCAWSTSAAWRWESDDDMQIAQRVIKQTELVGFESRLMNELS